MTRKGPAAAVAILVAALLGSSGPAPASGKGSAPTITVAGGVTQPAFSYEDAIRETVYVQSTIDQDLDQDLDLLATDIIRPAETEGSLKVPVIYEMSPYYQANGRGNEAEIKAEEDGDFIPTLFPLFYDNYFVPRGYAVVLQDMRGTRNSEGCMVLGDQEELIDAQATIDWLNGKGKAFTADGQEVEADWSSGKVGMIGKSYDGTIANGAASTGVAGLETIVPIAAISRWYDYHLNKGVQYLNAFLTPALFVFMIDQTPGDDEERGLEWVEATFGEAGPCSVEGAAIVGQAADPQADYNEFWDGRDYLKDVDKVRASVFLIHGLNDFNVKPNHYVQWWKGLARNDVPRKIWLSQTGHVDPFDFRRGQWIDTLHRWFDYWLQGIDNGIMGEPMADIERAPNKWTTYPTWPDAKARTTVLHLGPRDKGKPGILSLNPVRKPGTQIFTDDPNQSEGGMISNRRQTKDGRLLFLTKRLRRAVRISGTVHVRIRASVDQVDTNFTALLVDYGRGDKTTMRAHDSSGEGIRNLAEEGCYGESGGADNACYLKTEATIKEVGRELVSRGFLDARHHESVRSNSPLTPGETYTFKWSIFGEDYIFPIGHQIGIVIAGSDADYTLADQNGATITVKLKKSRVGLPVVGGADRIRPSTKFR